MSVSGDETSPVEPAGVGEGPTVLVVDDEPSNLASLQKIFEREKMRVLVADGAEG